MKSQCHIYKFTNTINNKVYIGYTSMAPNHRFAAHKCNHQNNKHSSYNFALYRAMRKHGFENFTFEVLYSSWDKTHTLTCMEPFFIKLYRSYSGFEDCNGYNLTLGGEGTLGWKHSYNKRVDMSLIAISKFKTGERKPTQHSDEWRQKLRECNKGGEATAVKVYQFSIEGELLQEYESASKAARYLGDVKYKGNILQATEQTYRAYKGYYWRKSSHIDVEVGEILNLSELKDTLAAGRNIRITNKSVMKYDIDFNLIAEYTSIEKALADNRPTSRETINARCLDGKLYKDCYWKFS